LVLVQLGCESDHGVDVGLEAFVLWFVELEVGNVWHGMPPPRSRR